NRIAPERTLLLIPRLRRRSVGPRFVVLVLAESGRLHRHRYRRGHWRRPPLWRRRLVVLLPGIPERNLDCRPARWTLRPPARVLVLRLELPPTRRAREPERHRPPPSARCHDAPTDSSYRGRA